MSDNATRLDRDRAALEAVEGKGVGAKIGTFVKLSGPGWLQSAITLGGGSLAGGLYLGVLSGYDLMWLQPLAMLLGVAMLASIAYVTLSTGRRPFRLVVDEVNPVLGWGWVIATMMANIVWCLPQFSLGMAALRQNLLPGLLGPEATGPLGGDTGTWVAIGALATCAVLTIISYERGGRGMAIFETVLKVLVGVIVLAFVGVVIKLTSVGEIDWGAVFSGLVPKLNGLGDPPAAFQEALAATSEKGNKFWTDTILGDRLAVMLTAAATAVGINMTFLLPNSLLDRGWDRKFRGLSAFDLGTALLIPFIIATGCVVISSASRFHGKYDESLVATNPSSGQYAKLLDARIAEEFPDDAKRWASEEKEANALLSGALANKDFEQATEAVAQLSSIQDERLERRGTLTDGDRQLAAMLIRRDAFDLAKSLAPLTGDKFAQIVFGGGVLAMALSTIVVLMLINGYVLSEIFDAPRRGLVHFAGTLLPMLLGIFAPILWTGDAKVWLAVPTSVIGFIFLPIAYVTFLLLMNNRRVLGDAMPTGGSRLAVNAVLGVAVILATVGAVISIQSSQIGAYGFVAAGVLVVLALVFRRKEAV